MKRILVTGGMGFIGSNFIRMYLESDSDVEIVNLDKLTYAGYPENLKDLENDDRYTFIKGDICDPKIVEKAMKNCDTVVHFAAESHVDRSINDPSSFIRTDVHGTFVLLEQAKKNELDKFVQISTDEVYGTIPEGYSSVETDPLMPRNPYSASKAGADRLAYSYFGTYNLPVVITRASNNYGPRQYPEKLIPLFVTNLIEGKKVPLMGDGKNIRDWLHVLDHCRGIEFLIKNGKSGEVYNIAGENEKENIEITRIILDELDLDEKMIMWVPDRLGHDRRYSMKCEKLKSLGWNQTMDFESGMRDTIRWYVANENWWKALKK